MADIDELSVIKTIVDALEKLDESARMRALRWVIDKFNYSGTTIKKFDSASVNLSQANSDEYDDFATLYAAAGPKIDAEKALVAAYWFQVVKGERDLSSQAINSELKQLGHGITNVTSALGSLMSTKPQHVLQIQKSGKSQQARKKYRLTMEGIKRVQEMLSQDLEI